MLDYLNKLGSTPLLDETVTWPQVGALAVLCIFCGFILYMALWRQP